MNPESRFTTMIKGAAVSGPPFGVINPAAGETFAGAPSCSPDQLDMAFGAVSATFPWWRADEAGRLHAMLATADQVDHADELALLDDGAGQAAAVRRYQMEWDRCGERAMGSRRVYPSPQVLYLAKV